MPKLWSTHKQKAATQVPSAAAAAAHGIHPCESKRPSGQLQAGGGISTAQGNPYSRLQCHQLQARGPTWAAACFGSN